MFRYNLIYGNAVKRQNSFITQNYMIDRNNLIAEKHIIIIIISTNRLSHVVCICIAGQLSTFIIQMRCCENE